MIEYRLPALPYDYGALQPHYDARTLELHHGTHHAAYVAGANSAASKLAQARERQSWEHLAALEASLAFHVSGHVLHAMFWENLSPGGGDKPIGELAAAIDEDLHSFDAFRDQMKRVITTLQGSGWGALVWDPSLGRLRIVAIHDHQHNHIAGAIPLLVIDGWEHAYYLQYGPAKDEYVDAIWHVVGWADVEARFEAASRIAVGDPSELVLP